MDISIFTLFLRHLITKHHYFALWISDHGLHIRGSIPPTAPEAQWTIEARGSNLETLKRRTVSAYLRRTYDEKRKRSSGAIVRPRSGSSGGGMKGPRARSYVGAPWFTVDDIFSLALVGAYRTTAPDNGGPAWHFVSNYCPALARTRPVLSISSVLYRSSTERDNALFYSALFLFCFACLLCFFFRRVIFRQPLALCCAVARRRRVSARISRLSWHRFIIAKSGCANRLSDVKYISEQIMHHFKYAYLCAL